MDDYVVFDGDIVVAVIKETINTTNNKEETHNEED